MVPRGRIVFPNAVKRAKSDSILVFAEPRMAELSKAAGAEFAGGMELVEDVVSGKIRPTMVLATPALAKQIAKPLGKVLGPLGLMPAERRGTVMDDPASHIMGTKESQQWSSDKQGVIRTAVAKAWSLINFPDLMAEVSSLFRPLLQTMMSLEMWNTLYKQLKTPLHQMLWIKAQAVEASPVILFFSTLPLQY